MPCFEVTLKKELTYYIVADTEEQARADADELNIDPEFDGLVFDSEMMLLPVGDYQPPGWAWVWHGGAAGRWDRASTMVLR